MNLEEAHQQRGVKIRQNAAELAVTVARVGSRRLTGQAVGAPVIFDALEEAFKAGEIVKR